jgi:hypothetical protein
MSTKKPIQPGADNHVQPAELIQPLERSAITKTVIISLALHAVAIVVFSVGNIVLCAKHGTLNPITAQEREDRLKKAEDDARKKAKRDALRAQQEAARKTRRAEEKPAKKTTPEEKPAESVGKTEDQPKSKVERTLRETSSEQPKKSSMSLDELDDDL